MPEMYIEPLTNRQECFNCQKTVTGKKKLWKCGGGQAITYCGQECQVEDRDRHKWNCVPVMVTEIPGKGRGLVAARDISMGELIFKDKCSIKLPVVDWDHNFLPGSDTITSLMNQIENLPSEAKLQFYKLKTPLDTLNFPGHKEFKIFLSNATDDYNIWRLYLNISLINHSCAPNAATGGLQPEDSDDISDMIFEIRAVKDIKRGEEVTICYLLGDGNSLAFKERRDIALEKFGFDCKCTACTCPDNISQQEEIFKEMFMLNLQLDQDHLRKNAETWADEAKIFERITELTLKTDIGRVCDKTRALDLLVIAAQMARDQDLLKKAMAMWKEVIENTKLEDLKEPYEKAERDLSQWTKQLKSKKNPKKNEIVAFLGSFTESEVEEAEMSKMNLVMQGLNEMGLL